MSRFWIALALLAGCTDNDLPPGSYLDHDRVLGARIEVTDDPLRASPLPGEQVTVRWIVAGPDDASAPDWRLGACAGTLHGCTAEPFVIEEGSGSEPRLVVTAPDASVLWVAGEIAGAKVTASVPIASGNHNPSLADATLAIAGTPWPATNGGCADQGAPVLRASVGHHELALTIAASAHETDDLALQVSHFTTVGTFERQFSVLEGEASTIHVDWIPPDDVIDPAGLLARFVIVLRDGRGGLDMLSREACIVP